MTDFRAACRDDPELHFPVGYTGPAAQRQIAKAKATCRSCPVLDGCLEWALANPVLTEFGITGGLTPKERQALRLAKEHSLANRDDSPAILSAEDQQVDTMPGTVHPTLEVPA